MLSICPSFNAAPRILDSDFTKRCAFGTFTIAGKAALFSVVSAERSKVQLRAPVNEELQRTNQLVRARFIISFNAPMPKPAARPITGNDDTNGRCIADGS